MGRPAIPPARPAGHATRRGFLRRSGGTAAALAANAMGGSAKLRGEKGINLPQAAFGVMCRNMVSVGHDGTLYDCDFNQMLELGVTVATSGRESIFDFDIDALLRRRIRFGDHCLGCTAGAGSSCGGATA